MRDRHVLVATASLHGVQVDELRIAPGESLEIGPHGRLRLPTGGAPFLAKADWTGPATLLVEDARGDRHRIGPDDDLDLTLGPVLVQLRVVRQFALRRTSAIPWTGSLAWFLTVLAFTLFVGQIDVVMRNRCAWFGIDCPVTQEVGAGWNAEYLARLLRKDLDGEDEGMVQHEPPKVGVRMPDVYLPAGDPTGPKDGELGGAAEVAPVPERAPPKPKESLPPAPKKVEQPLAVEDVGTPIAQEPVEEQPEGAAEAREGVEPEEPDQDEGEPTPPPAEEERGWGLADWMDATEEDREISMMLQIARRRLRIDPDNPSALSLLAYYQYLAEDLEGAERTYDRIIELLPDDAAAYNNKALVYKRRRDYAREEGLYRVALALHPADTTAMNNLAVNLAHQGRHEEALAWMKRLETLLPDDPYSDLHRAKIHAEMGNEVDALRYLDRALAGMARLDTLHHIEFRQDIRIDPSFERLRTDSRFRAILRRYYGSSSPLR